MAKIGSRFFFYQILETKKSILKLLSNLKNVSPSCISLIKSSWDISEIEDAYYPFKTQRKTKASVAIDAGLAELAKMILSSSDTITKDRCSRKIRGDSEADRSDSRGRPGTTEQQHQDSKRAYPR